MEVDQAQLANALIGGIRDAAKPNDLRGALSAVTRTVVDLRIADFASITERLDDRFHTPGGTDDSVQVVNDLQ